MDSNEGSDVDDSALDIHLPAKSKEKYLNTYEIFMHWKKKNNEDSFSEKVFMTYFTELSKQMKPSSLWAIYSMLKSTVRAKHKVFLQNYTNVTRFLRKNTNGFKSVSSKILTEQNIKKFINEAPDVKYLDMKVALILGVCGACRTTELVAITTKNIKFHDDMILVVVCDPQNKTDRTFIVRDEFAVVVRQYVALRPRKVSTDRFFLKYTDGKCVNQAIGKNKMATYPRQIATYLKLPNPKLYTGHCLRKSAASSGMNLMSLKRSIKGIPGDKTEVIDENEMIELVKRRRYTDKEPEINDEESNQEINVKIEEIEPQDNPDPLLISNDRFQSSMKSLYDLQISQSPASSPELQVMSEIPQQCDKESPDLIENSIHVKTDEIDETIVLPPRSGFKGKSQPSTSRQKVHVTSDEHQTHIDVAGKNISVTFNNCANVGNVIINILNK